MILEPTMNADGLADLLQRAAEDLREWADAAEESGSIAQTTLDLLEEIDAALMRHDFEEVAR